MMRQCGDCQLCCKLLPVPPLGKKAGERCKHQKFGVGCKVYHKPGMPPECAIWNCRWLVSDDTADLSRPDRSHYVIDIMPDFITMVDNETGERRHIQVAQIWVDANFPDAHRDPALRRWMGRRAREGIVALVRFNTKDAMTVVAPEMAEDGRWHEVTTNAPSERTHTLGEVVQALGGKVKVAATG
jgi:hypothetical protein